MGVYLTEYYDDKPDLASADPIAVTAGMTSTASAQLVRGGVITGTITAEGSGLPLENIDVNVYDAVTGAYIRDDDTDASGVYHIGSLTTGDYKLYFRDYSGVHLNEYYDDKLDFADADLVSVTSGMTTTANAVLSQGGRITGRVIDAQSDAGISGVSVRAERQDANVPDGTATTNADGYYTTTALYSGVYRVRFTPPQPYYAEYYDNHREWNAFTPVSVTVALTTTGIDAALRTGYLITGTVTGAGGQPLEDVRVRAYRGGSTSSSDSRYTDSEGRYQLGPLDAHRYRVSFESQDQHISEWYDDALAYTGTTVIDLMAGDAVDVDAQLAVGGIITGLVTGPGQCAARRCRSIRLSAWGG